MLAAAGPDGLSNDQLADQIWAEQPPPSWRSAVRNTISRLNRKVEQASAGQVRLVSARSRRRLEVDPANVDLWRLLDTDSGAELSELELLAAEPFPECEISSILRESLDAVASARADLLTSWRETGRTFTDLELSELRRLVRSDPFDQSLAGSVGRPPWQQRPGRCRGGPARRGQGHVGVGGLRARRTARSQAAGPGPTRAERGLGSGPEATADPGRRHRPVDTDPDGGSGRPPPGAAGRRQTTPRGIRARRSAGHGEVAAGGRAGQQPPGFGLPHRLRGSRSTQPSVRSTRS